MAFPNTSMRDRHFLLLPLPAWGHTRPLCVLAARLVSERENIVVTLLVVPHMVEKCQLEIFRQFKDDVQSKFMPRIRVIATFKSNDTDMFKLIPSLAQSYPATYRRLYEGKALTCASTGMTFDATPVPTAIIMDFFAIFALHATRAISGRSVPIIAWITGGAASVIRLFGSEAIGGIGDLGAKIDREADRTGLSEEEIGDNILKHTSGEIVKIPGLPPMYDYEFFPQKLPFTASISSIVRGGYSFLVECDSVLISSSAAYESVPLETLKGWFSSLNKPVYALGPLLPLDYGCDEAKFEAHGDIGSFLARMQEKYGEHSLLFISLGTLFWTTNPEYIEEIVETLMDKEFPFLLCHASPYAVISEDLLAKVNTSGIGMFTKWCPQQDVLNHQVTGWFLTHCGHGGVTEALGSGIPMICWPFDADQPAAASHLTENLQVAFELIEVRTGEGLKPLLRNGRAPSGTLRAVRNEMEEIIGECRGEKGKKLRRNAIKLRIAFKEAWEEEGSAKQDLTSLLNCFV